MKFCVRHRTSNGVITETTIEAADRNGVFAELSRRGITAISVSEGEAKLTKRHSHSAKKSSGASGNLWKWCAGVSAALIVGAGVYLFLQSGMGQSEDTTFTDKGKIVSQLPAKAGKNGKITDVTTAALPTEVDADDISKNATNGIASAAMSKSSGKFRIVRRNNGKKLFHNVADVYISRLVNSTPGSGVIGTMNYDRFAEQLKRALTQPITIDEDDTPEEVAKKQAVIETRAELKKMLDDGVDVSKVMREAESEMRRLWNYRRTLHLELAKAHKEGAFNSKDMRDYIDVANKMLTDNGMEPLKHPEFWIRRLKHEEEAGK